MRKYAEQMLMPKGKRGLRVRNNNSKEKDRSQSRNSSINRLKNRVGKLIGQPHMTAEKDIDSEEEKDYDPKKRGIGMDFLEYVKKKPKSKTNKMFLSTQKTASDWSVYNKQDKLDKKLRPNSAQNSDSHAKLKHFDDVFSMNEDLDPQITPIKETAEEAITNRVSDEYLIKEKSIIDSNGLFIKVNKKPKNLPSDNNDEQSLNGKPMKPVYNKNDENFNLAPQIRSARVPNENTFKGKRKSRSKNRKAKPSEERKGSRNGSLEQPKQDNSKFNKSRKSLSRPFSGGTERPLTNQKVILKSNKPKERPKTAKNKGKNTEKELRSPISRKMLSPKSSKKSLKRLPKTKGSKVLKSGKKKLSKPSTNLSSKNQRKTSLSPNTQISNELAIDTHINNNGGVPSWINRRSMNDLKNPDPEIPINVLTNNFVKQDHDAKINIIQKYMKGYKVYNDINKQLVQLRDTNSRNGSGSSSNNTFARATNQTDILISMNIAKEKTVKELDTGDNKYEEQKHIEMVTRNYNPQHEDKQRVENKLKIIEKKKRHHANDIHSKSIASFEKEANHQNKEKMREIITKSLKLLKKKRPTSAKEQSAGEDKGEVKHAKEKFVKILDKLKGFKTKRQFKSPHVVEAVNANANKPPISDRSKRNERSITNKKSTDSMSERLSQVSPTIANSLAFSSKKYQEILDKHVYDDYTKESKYVEQRLKTKKEKYQNLYNENKLSSNSFERHKKEIETWAVKTQKNIEEKKNKYLSVFSNLGEYADIIKNKEPVPRRITKNPSLSDSEIKLSEDISQSEMSNRHKKSNSSYLKNEARNYMKEEPRYHLMNKNKNKSVEKLNLSKDGHKTDDRLSRLKILEDKDRSFSTKGPVMIQNMNKTFSADEELESMNDKTGRKSELIPQTNFNNLDLDDENDKSSQLKEFLKDKIIESQKRNQEADELVAFPSDDEVSKKNKIEVLNELNSLQSESEIEEESKSEVSIEKAEVGIVPDVKEDREEPVQIIKETKEEKKVKHKSLQKSEGEEWPSGFPSLVESINSQDDQKAKVLCPNSDLVGDILNNEDGKDSLYEEGIIANPKSTTIGVLSDNDKEEAIEDLFNSSNDKSDEEKVVLIESTQPVPLTPSKETFIENILASEISPKSDEKNKSPFSEREQEQNRAFATIDSPVEDEVPSITNSEKKKDSTPSLQDIMNDDLTGTSAPATKTQRKSRTEDDLPGGPKPSTQQKADTLADELAFYLVMEIRNSMFPQRVNPERLRLRTAEEIERVEKAREEKKQLDSTLPSSDGPEDEHKEEDQEEDFPQCSMAIKTNPNTIKNYMEVLFSKIEGREEDFIANLSSPLQRNPLEILMHLQNTQYELEDHEQLPYQQSVLSVDIYLDIERSRKRQEEQDLNDKRAESKTKHEEDKKKKEEDKHKEEDKKDEHTNSEKPEGEEEKDENLQNNDDVNNSSNSKALAVVSKDDSSDDTRSEYTRNDDLLVHLFNLK